ncbi:TetR/AcrR family transcriptional regulator C-terminal domain-containing protein [Streptomyces sp. NPDC086989]|uniref:TetR/AcrR family transcriptional regulator C-terminal domain-containing protein n=1 Tax=Streptomyces sp. NPDC086989 TaxID=3365764 RepID=UPI00382499A9
MSSPSSPAGPPTRTTARGRPAKLDPDRTVATALDLLDEAGLDALTMRRLAEAMGVQAGALYRYFATKQDLLTAMAERMLADRDTRAPGGADQGDWAEELTGRARALRAALLRHRDGARVFAGTHSTGGNTLGFAEALIGALREAGFGASDAARAMLAVVNFTLGHTLEEQAALGGEAPADPERLRLAVTESAFPHLAASVPVIAGGDFDAHFEFGLRLLVNGLRTLEK